MVERDNKEPPIKIIAEKIISNYALIGAAVFVVASIIVISISISLKYYVAGFGEKVLVEAHGILFDILIFGILILFLNKLAENRITNQRYKDEIDDFRGWKSEEAAFRIAGNIKRLNRNGYKGEINLARCHMSNVNLVDINLAGAFLRGANFTEANLMRANFVKTNLRRVNFELANLMEANLMKANLKRANLKGAGLELTNLEEAILWGADLSDANLTEANLKRANLMGADLKDADLEGTNLVEANLENVKNLTIHQVSTVKSLYKAKLDSGLKEQIKEECPHLLEEPKPDE